MSTSFLSTEHLQAAENAAASKVADTPTERPRAESLPDLFLTLKVREAFAAEPALMTSSIVIEVFAGIVYLTGMVNARYQQTVAMQVAGSVGGVHSISNCMQVVPPSGKNR